MPVPDYQTFMKPVLELAETEQKYSVAVQKIGDLFNLTEEDRAEATGKGTNLLDNRVGWALTYLVKAGLVKRPRRGYFVITALGNQSLSSKPEKIDNKFLAQFEGFKNFRGSPSNRTSSENTTSVISNEETTPEERIDASFDEIETEFKAELLNRILNQSPTFFEELVVTLLSAMGYGDRGSLSKAVGKSGDGGIDGVIHQDKLGLDVVYLQAKRYAPGNSVGRPELQGFVGTLSGVSAQKGVFVATSHFSSGALEYLRTIPQRVITIDGNTLVELMLENGVGVKIKKSYQVHRIDEDFFLD